MLMALKFAPTSKEFQLLEPFKDSNVADRLVGEQLSEEHFSVFFRTIF